MFSLFYSSVYDQFTKMSGESPPHESLKVLFRDLFISSLTENIVLLKIDPYSEIIGL